MATVVVIFLILFSLASWAQNVPNVMPVRDLLAVRPTDRIIQPIDENRRAVLSGHLHPMARAENTTGYMPSEQRMEQMVLVLRGNSEQETALEELIEAQQDPGSAYYHQWLTPQAFAQRFGTSVNDLKQISGWLQSHGMEIEETPSNRAVIFSGSAWQVETTFHTTMRTYVVNGEAHYANATDPEIPEALAHVIHGVASLHNFVSEPMHVTAPAFTSGSAHYLMPRDWAMIYDVTPLYNAGITGSGESIAVLGRSDIYVSDVQSFRANAALPANNPQTIVNGADPGVSNSGDQMESTLDVEWAGAVAQKAAVKFVTSKSGSSDGIALSAQYAVAHNVAPIVSLSYGMCEAAEGSGGNAFWNNLWEQAAAQGMSVFVSAGDSGAAGCDASNARTATEGRAVNGLCSSPYSTCVGGTEFSEGSNSTRYWASSNGVGMSSALAYIPENVWNESGSDGLWAGGGGASTVYSKPSWQSAPGVPADGKRDVPDVAMTAAIHDSYVILMDGSLQAVAGTSAAAPSLAGAMALVVQKAGASQGNVNPVLYRLATRQLSDGGADVFHDITSGNNSVPGVSGFNAGTGYDAATGLGSIDADLLASHWNDASANFALTLGSSSVIVGKGTSNSVSLSVSPSDGFNSPVTLSASGAASGVTVRFSSASLTASSHVTVTISAATTAAAGNSTLTITGKGAGLSRTVTLTLSVKVPTVTLTANAASASVATGKKAALTLTTAAQNLNSAVALSVSGLPKGVTASFAPAGIASPGSGRSTLTLTAASGATSGTAKVTVKATGGGLTKTQVLSLTVTR
ncbi:MAG: protease pro-enzyme activation domain-containing protein [Candidatus Sulfotelmatobacter sp.]